MRRLVLTPVLVAAGGFAFFFFELRSPGCLGPFMFPLGLVVFFFLTVACVIRSMIHARGWNTKGVALAAGCVVAPLAGWSLGMRSRDARFLDWRLPLYRRVVERVRGDPSVTQQDSAIAHIKLQGEEIGSAYAVTAWLEGENHLVVRFYWAGSGPPPKHWFYTYFDSEEHARGRRLADHWFEGAD